MFLTHVFVIFQLFFRSSIARSNFGLLMTLNVENIFSIKIICTHNSGIRSQSGMSSLQVPEHDAQNTFDLSANKPSPARPTPAHFTFHQRPDTTSAKAMSAAVSLPYQSAAAFAPAPTPSAYSASSADVASLPPGTARSFEEIAQIERAIDGVPLSPATAAYIQRFAVDDAAADADDLVDYSSTGAVVSYDVANDSFAAASLSPQSQQLHTLEQQFYQQSAPRHSAAAGAASLSQIAAAPFAISSTSPAASTHYSGVNTQLQADEQRLRARRHTQRAAEHSERLAAAIDAWSQRRFASGGTERVQQSVRTAISGSGATVARTAPNRLVGAQSQASSSAPAGGDQRAREFLLLDSDLEDEDGGGGESFSFGLTARIKAARAQFWDSVTNISQHLTSLDVDEHTHSRNGGGRALMHSILDEPADRLRHLLRLHQARIRRHCLSARELSFFFLFFGPRYSVLSVCCFLSLTSQYRVHRHMSLFLLQDALRAERELRIAEAAVLLDANLHLKKLRRVENLLAISAAVRAASQSTRADDRNGDGDASQGDADAEHDADADEVEFCRAAQAILLATDVRSEFRVTHSSQRGAHQ